MEELFLEGDFPISEMISNPCPAWILIFPEKRRDSGSCLTWGRISIWVHRPPSFSEQVAASNQEYEFKLLGEGFDEEQGLFFYQLFSGVNLYPSDHMLSLRYRWLKMGKMEQFGDRDLHMLELGSGISSSLARSSGRQWASPLP